MPTTIIRVATAADAAPLCAIYAPIVRDTAITFETEPPAVEKIERRIAETLPLFPWLIAEQNGLVVGTAYASAHRERPAYRWSVNTSVYLAPEARGSGVGRALYVKLLGILSEQGFHSAFAGIAMPNDASVGLHKAMGFEPVGTYKEVGFKHGQWRDVSWWRLGLSVAPADPKDPVPFAAIVPQVGM